MSKNGSRWQKDSTYRTWQGNLPSTVGAEDGRTSVTRDLLQKVGLTLPSAVGSASKGGSNPFQTCCLPIAFVCNLIFSRLDYLQGCLELKREEESRVTNSGLIRQLTRDTILHF
ncbi:hypothetical protein M9H77_23459 [Catharanthus roseus]|uniref:Uncharacterized protein n=1 Tax=Catharanthus roseus TaxID=4058 RepID=A0ACC0ATT0_CATRO|nr:hypothetical protein M9H77_23459 [Catharanthus roseus]